MVFKVNKLLLFSILLLLILPIYSPASLLDTPSPYWSQNRPLGRNPARSAYLKDQNRLNISYTLGTQVNYTDNFYKSIEGWYPFFKDISGDTSNPYTNAYFSYSVPLFKYLHLGLVYNNAQFSRKTIYNPDDTLYPGAIIKYNEDTNLSEIQDGLTIASGLFNDSIFFGIEALQGDDLFDYTSYEHLTIPLIQSNNIGQTTFKSDHYYIYTAGFLIPWKMLTFSLTQTVTTPKFVNYEYRYIDKQQADLNDSKDAELWNYYPPVTGLGILFTPARAFQIGISTEFYGYGMTYDQLGEENYVQTKPFTRYSIGLETVLGFFTFRTFGSITPEKDGRTNYYDWYLLYDKLYYLPEDDFENDYIFHEEEFGLDLEFTFSDTVSAVFGAGKKNYIFPSDRTNGIALAVDDIRSYFGISIIGLFQGGSTEKKPQAAPEKKAKRSLPATPELVPTPAVGEVENSVTPRVGEPGEYTTFKEEVYVSAQSVFPGEDVQVFVKEGQNKLFKATVSYQVGAQEYRYPLYQAEPKVWKANVPISPLTPAGTYTLKINKIYDDTSLEISDFAITVKQAPQEINH